MNREDAIQVLLRHEHNLRARGVQHAALFGSTARDEAGPSSDVDVLIELSPDAKLDVFDYVELKQYIATLFPTRVDVVNRDGLKPYIRRPAAADAIYAF
jgi:predicted nucleotidyltransferase